MLGILDNFNFGLGIPIILNNTVDVEFGWEPGDYQWNLGRPYSAEDFWQWAASMGQPKPESWEGNQGTPSNIVFGGRLRWTDWIDWCKEAGLHSALTVFIAMPTGSPPDSEEILGAGTTLWDIQAQGDLAFHLGIDKTFPKLLDNRLRLGLDIFYEYFLPQNRRAGTGAVHPLLLNEAYYVGPWYEVKPGDFTGFAVQADVVPYRGPANKTWITGDDESKAEKLPPIITVSVGYKHTWMLQSDYTSQSDLWDWKKEKPWLPGYKNILSVSLDVGLYRVGVPLSVYGQGRSGVILPGKNTPAASVLTVGLKAPIPLW